MRVIVQRVKRASVEVNKKIVGKICLHNSIPFYKWASLYTKYPYTPLDCKYLFSSSLASIKAFSKSIS